MIDEYLKAKKLGDKAFHQAVLNGQYPYIACLDDILQGKNVSARRIAIDEIPLRQVAGTKTSGRQNSFAPDFMPLAGPGSEFAGKWMNVYKYQVSQGVADAVQVFEYRHRFYVQEGNKRVSVFRYLNMLTIPADVQRITDGEEDALTKEFYAFFRCVPIYEIDFREVGRYKAFVRMLGKNLDEPWSHEEVRKLKSLYYMFERLYLKQHPEADSGTISEGLFVYASLYGLESLKKDPAAAVASRMRKLKKEFELAAKEETVVLADPPQESAEQGLLGILPKIVPVPALHAAFVYDSDPEHSGDVFEHEIGRILLENSPGGNIVTEKYENCDTEEKLEYALNQAAGHADIVFTTSPVQMNAALKAAVQHPAVRFMNCSLNLKVNAVQSYAVRTYEGKFLLGALAAGFSRDHRIAYIADYPVYGTIAEINAFAIGVSMIDPEAEVFLCWSETLDEDWKEQMMRLGITVFSGPDSLEQKGENTEYGIFRIDENGNSVNLAAPVINWAVYYEKLTNMVRKGKIANTQASSVNYWWGMNAGVLDISLSGALPYQTRKMMQIIRQAMIRGTLNPFSGELHSQEGMIRDASSEGLTNEEIIRMDWLNDNIIGSIPPFQKLNDAAKKMTEISGIGKMKEQI